MNARQFKKLREQVNLAARNMVKQHLQAFMPAVLTFGAEKVNDMLLCVVNQPDGYSRMRCLQDHYGWEPSVALVCALDHYQDEIANQIAAHLDLPTAEAVELGRYIQPGRDVFFVEPDTGIERCGEVIDLDLELGEALIGYGPKVENRHGQRHYSHVIRNVLPMRPRPPEARPVT
ncbi:MAG: hypothetical protein KA185_15660 [Vitreoscilla sp.]|nr:hypothetical protein [Vitreoscilla sp.]